MQALFIFFSFGRAKITEENIKEILGRCWAWKMRRLFDVVRFEIGDWQDAAVQVGIVEHNLEVRQRWLADGRDPDRDCWWHITQISLDHFRPSPEWKKQGQELQLGKEYEADIRKWLKVVNARKRA